MPHANTEIRPRAEQWIQAWDARDLDGIMKHYSQDVDFEANTVIRPGCAAKSRGSFGLIPLATLESRLEPAGAVHCRSEDSGVFSRLMGNGYQRRALGCCCRHCRGVLWQGRLGA